MLIVSNCITVYNHVFLPWYCMHTCAIIVYNHVLSVLYCIQSSTCTCTRMLGTVCTFVLLFIKHCRCMYVYYFMLSLSRVTILLDDTAAISPSAFAISIWNTLYRSPSLRQPAAEYMLGHLNKGKSEVCQTLKRIDECQDVMVITMFMEFPCSLFQLKIHV